MLTPAPSRSYPFVFKYAVLTRHNNSHWILLPFAFLFCLLVTRVLWVQIHRCYGDCDICTFCTSSCDDACDRYEGLFCSKLFVCGAHVMKR